MSVSTKQTTKILSLLQQHVNSLTSLERKHYVADQDIHENDISHSYSVALFAWELQQTYAPHLSLEKVLTYALIHDFVEVYAGDVMTYAPAKERAQKLIDEQKSLKKLQAEYADFPGLCSTIEYYERRDDEESAFVWSCDKIQDRLHAKMNGWRNYKELGITHTMFVDKADEHRRLLHPSLYAYFDEFIASCLESYPAQDS